MIVTNIPIEKFIQNQFTNLEEKTLKKFPATKFYFQNNVFVAEHNGTFDFWYINEDISSHLRRIYNINIHEIKLIVKREIEIYFNCKCGNLMFKSPDIINNILKNTPKIVIEENTPKNDFNGVLKLAIQYKSSIYRKKDTYLFNTITLTNDIENNLTANNCDYFAIITKDNQIAEFILLGKTKSSIDLKSHVSARKYTTYATTDIEDNMFKFCIMGAIKKGSNIIYKNAKDGYMVSYKLILKDILNSHYFLIIKDGFFYEYFRFDIRTITDNMELPKL